MAAYRYHMLDVYENIKILTCGPKLKEPQESVELLNLITPKPCPDSAKKLNGTIAKDAW